jgi:Uma2 family endonuclease
VAIRRAPQSVTGDLLEVDQEPSLRLFTVDEYYKMAEVGILRPDERVQLIEGKIVQMPPVGPRHAFNVSRLTQLLFACSFDGAEVRVQSSVRLASGAEPEPDLAIVRSHPDAPRTYESRHPRADEVSLIIEVADSTLAFDLGEKAASYARHGVVELWVIDLPGDRVVVHRGPTPDGYASIANIMRGMTITALAFPDVTFTADEILG